MYYNTHIIEFKSDLSAVKELLHLVSSTASWPDQIITSKSLSLAILSAKY